MCLSKQKRNGWPGAQRLAVGIGLFVKTLIVLDVHPHGEQKRLKGTYEEKRKRQHGQGGYAVICKEGNSQSILNM